MVPTKFSEQGNILDSIRQEGPSFDHYSHYYSSKLFELLWALAFSRRVDEKKLDVSFVTPGLCKSELFRNVRSKPTDILALLFARSCDDGARMLMLASTSDCEIPPYSYWSQGSLVP